MAFKNEKINYLSERFKKRLKGLNPNVKAWSIDTEISLNAAYSYMDVNRHDNHMPAFLLATLPPDISESLFQMLRDMAMFKEERNHTQMNVNELLTLHFQFLKEFSDVTRSIVEALEDGKVTEDEFFSYEKERAEFLAIDAQLHSRLKQESEYWED
jgi:hypothetical protein